MSKEISTQNTYETEKRTNSAILKALATTELGNIAPLLSLARVVDAQNNIGMTYSISVDNVEIREMRSYKILRIVINTITSNQNLTQKRVGVLYTFRMITPSLFEPFIFIGKNKGIKSIFAYVDEEEFLFSSLDGNERQILSSIYSEAIKSRKNILARYIDLIINGFTKI